MWNTGNRVIFSGTAFTACLAVAALSGGACIPDWDVYDPRLSGAASAGGTGGAASASSAGTGGGGGGTSVCDPGTSVSCYTGPAATEGVGDCVVGTQTCSAVGDGYGPCEGEVLPSAETCETPGDEDCDGATNEEGAGCACEPGAVQACYTGPQSTMGVGVCEGGMQMCDPDGVGFGPCMGEVVPSLESCATDADDDCSGTPNENCATWTKSFGSAGDQMAWDIAVDSAGAVVMAGRFINTINFGGGVLVSQGANDAFVARFTAAGDYVWQKRFGDIDEQEAMGVAVDGANNVYVTGFFAGTVSFDGTPASTHTSKGVTDIFVVKYDAQGSYVWSKAFGDPAAQAGLSVAVDALGNVFLTGRIAGTVSFGGAALAAAGTTNGFIVKLDPLGTHVFSKIIGTTGNNAGHGVATDADGNVVVAGFFDATINFGSGPLSAAGGVDVFAAKLGPMGDPLWVKIFGDGPNQRAFGVDMSSSGDVVVLGEYAGELDFGGGEVLTSAGLDDIFVAMLDGASGSTVWAKGFGDAADQEALDVTLTPMGNVVFTGALDGTVDFGGGSMTASSPDDIYLVKLSGASGDHVWSRRFGGSGDQDGRAVATDAMGNVLFAGEYSTKVDFGSGEITSTGGEDICLVKLPP
jgi:hypothetical protein